MNFYQLLILFSFAFFTVTSVSLFYIRKESTPKKMGYKPHGFSIYYSIFILLLILTGYYSIIGARTPIWFGLFSVYIILSLFHVTSERKSQSNFVTVSLLLLSIALLSVPIIENRTVIFGPDQWRDLKITSFILNEGTFKGAASGYYSLPLFNIINSVLTKITGWQTMFTFTAIGIVYSIITILSIYLIIMKLSDNRIISFIAIALFLSTPRLAFVQAIPSTASMALGILLLLFIIDEKTQSHALYIAPFIAFTTIVIHPIGIIPCISILIGIISLGYINPNYKIETQSKTYLKIIFTMIIIIIITYLGLNTNALSVVIASLKKLISTLSNINQSTSPYIPQYETNGSLIYSYVWALPVSLTATYLIMFLIYERKNSKKKREQAEYFILASAFISLVFLLVAFLSIIREPGASLERYLNVPAYTLMLFPSAFVIYRMISTYKKAIVLLAFTILIVNVYIGTSSPDWAPFENSAFGAYRSTYSGYMEAQIITNTLPPGIRVYEDNDIPIAEVASLQGLQVKQDQSYQTIRKVIQDFKNNKINYKNKLLRLSIVYLQTSEIEDQGLYKKYIDLVYNSGVHSGMRLSGLVE